MAVTGGPKSFPIVVVVPTSSICASADEKQRVATSDVPPNIGKIDKRKTKSESLSNNKRVTVVALVPVASTGDQPWRWMRLTSRGSQSPFAMEWNNKFIPLWWTVEITVINCNAYWILNRDIATMWMTRDDREVMGRRTVHGNTRSCTTMIESYCSYFLGRTSSKSTRHVPPIFTVRRLGIGCIMYHVSCIMYHVS